MPRVRERQGGEIESAQGWMGGVSGRKGKEYLGEGESARVDECLSDRKMKNTQERVG